MFKPAPALKGAGVSRPRATSGAVTTLGEVLARVVASPAGLTSTEAAGRLGVFGPNRLRDDDGNHPLAILLRQFRSPMVLILLGAATLSFLLGEIDEAIIVGVIVFASSGLGFYQEYRAGNAVAELRRRIATSSMVLRDGQSREVPAAEIVPGDIIILSAGSLISADAVLIEASALHVDEAALTGESFPAVKQPAAAGGAVDAANRVHMGTSVRSGEGRAVVVETGTRTEFGSIATSVAAIEPETSFARGTRRFGLLMTQIMLVLVTFVLVANVLLGRPVLDSLLFAAALAVGITPELLPAIVSVTLAQGARRLTERGVLVRRLMAIENLGAMNVLCTDKTGTLTVGQVGLTSAVDVDGNVSAATLKWAMLNASLQRAMPNPLDTAILARCNEVDLIGYEKHGDVPYDFERKRLSVLVGAGQQWTLVCKGAVAAVLAVSTTILVHGVTKPLTDGRRRTEERRLADWSGQGLRVLAVATRGMNKAVCQISDEADMILVGYLLFSDPLKPNIAATIAALRQNGVGLKVISGDNRYVAAHVAESIGLSRETVVSGVDLEGLTDLAFARRVTQAAVFAEVAPDQKQRIIAALRKAGNTVGYMGDGINDAPALRTADIGISVDNAVDAAKASADVILLKQDLNVLLDGVIAGRTAFGNTIKYIAITISANLGNMISMAIASLLLPFLPMLPTQILLNNLLSDLPMLAISTDRVDAELLIWPRQWNFGALLRSMFGFGLLSSCFDLLTFFLILGPFHSNAPLFQTSWFLESLLTELAVVAAMRTHKSLFRSLPGPLLMWTSASVAVIALALPYLPVAGFFGLVPIPGLLLVAILVIVVAYVAATELLKGRLGVLVPATSTSATG
ncbi:MAG: magnesium-translocating P-type ATPase [Devosia sp.]